ncbi:CDC48 family AAA ATPase [Xanthobacter agilis]|jgi:transitional endoplasmic reticulum ATPase|uniref:Transitional endoplasmic reticulum ATPase n=1 Tax=Xanthobacter agilis TaxID=47492 RepID=A0ABU0LJ04_XANAG|nr:CDC48 family AAA ATPase [Xanthobacter agilis]MDQ0507106.1 transitional endoplasmic reticulum ATPase [Xanthobacter agilis]
MTDERPPVTFRVCEAPTRDVGRGLIRLDPEDMQRLGVVVGDVVSIVGRRATVARVMPAHAGMRRQSLVQMDGLARVNAGASLDEQVTVGPATVALARSITLAQVGARTRAPAEPRTLTRLLDGIPMVAGDRVRTTLVGAQTREFMVESTDPPGPVLIGPDTRLRFLDSAVESNAITYEDVGGLTKEVRRIREMIELPLKHPEVFQHLGIESPKGVLLCGPPGTGKTLIARAVAREANVHFIHLNGPEIIDKMYGASEAQLRRMFDEAEKNAPSIIFIDELDAIAPKREEMSGDRQVERRVVAQLLGLMDGLQSRGQVIVIAATNIPNAIDPALRRPGRFDREIQVGVPDENGRREILEIHTRGMPLAPDVDLARLAFHTPGFVGADLAALCREAAMSALRRLIPDLNFEDSRVSEEKLAALVVTAEDFASAQAGTQPSALREIVTQASHKRWADVGGLDDIKRLLVEAVEWPTRHAALYAAARIQPPKGILFYGAPGTGKTLLAKALAGESGANFIAVKGPQLLSMWAGESERGVREVFRKARQTAPCIIFFDEIDTLTPNRGGTGGALTDRVVAQLLTEIDGIEDLRGVTVVAATNRLDQIDAALLRPGRFDFLVEFQAPDLEGRRAILDVHAGRMPLAPGVDLAALARNTAGMVGADLEALCRHAGVAAIRELVARGGDEAAAAATLRVTQQHFDDALIAMKRERAP